MSHDDAWRFLILGQSLERIDMTARLLLARMAAAPSEAGWPMLLRAAGAYESFIRTRSWTGDTAQEVAEFLILDPLFPRSVLHTLGVAEDCLAALDSGPQRAGLSDPARRPIGRLRGRLEYADPKTLPDQLGDVLSTLQETCLEATEAISGRYFSYAQPVAWAREG